MGRQFQIVQRVFVSACMILLLFSYHCTLETLALWPRLYAWLKRFFYKKSLGGGDTIDLKLLKSIPGCPSICWNSKSRHLWSDSYWVYIFSYFYRLWFFPSLYWPWRIFLFAFYRKRYEFRRCYFFRDNQWQWGSQPFFTNHMDRCLYRILLGLG